MPSVRTLLARVQRLEAARTAPASPIVQYYGSVEGYAKSCAGLDQQDMQFVIAALHRWERDGVWNQWERQRHGVWEMGK